MAQWVKRLPTMWETRVWSLGREDPLEKEMATHSSTLPWKITWTEKPGRPQSMGSQRVGHDWATKEIAQGCCEPYMLAVGCHFPCQEAGMWVPNRALQLLLSWDDQNSERQGEVSVSCKAEVHRERKNVLKTCADFLLSQLTIKTCRHLVRLLSKELKWNREVF